MRGIRVLTTCLLAACADPSWALDSFKDASWILELPASMAETQAAEKDMAERRKDAAMRGEALVLDEEGSEEAKASKRANAVRKASELRLSDLDGDMKPAGSLWLAPETSPAPKAFPKMAANPKPSPGQEAPAGSAASLKSGTPPLQETPHSPRKSERSGASANPQISPASESLAGRKVSMAAYLLSMLPAAGAGQDEISEARGLEEPGLLAAAAGEGFVGKRSPREGLVGEGLVRAKAVGEPAAGKVAGTAGAASRSSSKEPARSAETTPWPLNDSGDFKLSPSGQKGTAGSSHAAQDTGEAAFAGVAPQAEIASAETTPVEMAFAKTASVEIGPLEAEPAETEPAETEPAETKPVETKIGPAPTAEISIGSASLGQASQADVSLGNAYFGEQAHVEARSGGKEPSQNLTIASGARILAKASGLPDDEGRGSMVVWSSSLASQEEPESSREGSPKLGSISSGPRGSSRSPDSAPSAGSPDDAQGKAQENAQGVSDGGGRSSPEDRPPVLVSFGAGAKRRKAANEEDQAKVASSGADSPGGGPPSKAPSGNDAAESGSNGSASKLGNNQKLESDQEIKNDQKRGESAAELLTAGGREETQAESPAAESQGAESQGAESQEADAETLEAERLEMEKLKAAAERQRIYEESLAKLLPASPDEVREYRKRADKKLEASGDAPAGKLLVRTVPVRPEPGEKPPVVELTPNMVTALLFNDSQGRLWPIASCVLGSGSLFQAEVLGSDSPGSIIVAPLGNHGSSNLIVTLRDLDVPLVIELKAASALKEGRNVDALVVFQVGELGPKSASLQGARVQAPSKAVSDKLYAVMDGITPNGARILEADPALEGERVFLSGDSMYLRTRRTLLWPAPRARAAGPGGLTVYELSPMTTLLLSSGEEISELRVPGAGKDRIVYKGAGDGESPGSRAGSGGRPGSFDRKEAGK